MPFPRAGSCPFIRRGRPVFLSVGLCFSLSALLLRQLFSTSKIKLVWVNKASGGLVWVEVVQVPLSRRSLWRGAGIIL